MKGKTYVMRNGKLVEKQFASPFFQKEQVYVWVHSDTMDPLKHPGTGKIHDSKSNFRADTRAMGLTEVGNDAAARRPGKTYQVSQRDVVPDVKRAIQELNSR